MKRGTPRLLSILLALCLALALPPGTALAADVELSPQRLTVDGKNVDCERYNIDGANYFKLRDLAYLLNGTLSQFSVEKHLILITNQKLQFVPLEFVSYGVAARARATVRAAVSVLSGANSSRASVKAFNQ